MGMNGIGSDRSFIASCTLAFIWLNKGPKLGSNSMWSRMLEKRSWQDEIPARWEIVNFIRQAHFQVLALATARLVTPDLVQRTCVRLRTVDAPTQASVAVVIVDFVVAFVNGYATIALTTAVLLHRDVFVAVECQFLLTPGEDQSHYLASIKRLWRQLNCNFPLIALTHNNMTFGTRTLGDFFNAGDLCTTASDLDSSYALGMICATVPVFYCAYD
jgi:hypothetical protein